MKELISEEAPHAGSGQGSSQLSLVGGMFPLSVQSGPCVSHVLL